MANRQQATKIRNIIQCLKCNWIVEIREKQSESTAEEK